jgi:DNA-binding GntR family transcriptional regulator
VPLVAQRISRRAKSCLLRQLRDEHSTVHRASTSLPGRATIHSFHLRLAELSGNAILHGFTCGWSRCSFADRWRWPEPPGSIYCEHDGFITRIIDYIENGIQPKTVRVVNRHLLDLERHAWTNTKPKKAWHEMLGLG